LPLLSLQLNKTRKEDMNKTLFESILSEAKVTNYDMDDYQQDEYEDLMAEENRHKKELIDFCKEDPEHNYVVTDVTSRYNDRYFDESAKNATFETIEDIYDYVKENFPGETVVKINFNSVNFGGCREVRIINDYDD
jgi:thymidylate synthase